MIPATYDNATKLIHVQGQDFVGAVTYGLGVIGQDEPRTVHSFLPELDAEMGKNKRLKVKDFAKQLGEFFMKRWQEVMPAKTPPDAQIIFLVGGYDDKETYGEICELRIPGSLKPRPLKTGKQFGISWGGQTQFTERLINGLDRQLVSEVQKLLELEDSQKTTQLYEHLLAKLSAKIPYQFLPLQDCVDLTKLVIETTAALQSFVTGVRGVGGPVDMAVITRHNGYKPLQQKEIHA